MIQQMRTVNPSAAAQMEQMLPMLENPLFQQQMNAAQDMMRNMGMNGIGPGLGGFGNLQGTNQPTTANNNNGGNNQPNNNNGNNNNQNQSMSEEDMINEAIARSLREM